MTKKITGILMIMISVFLVSGCAGEEENAGKNTKITEEESSSVSKQGNTEGTEEYRGFILDNILHSESEGDIHYNLYIPRQLQTEVSLMHCSLHFPGMRDCIFREWAKICTVRISDLKPKTI